jgi:hypothetical protein
MWELQKEALIYGARLVVRKFVNTILIHWFYFVQLSELLYVSLLFCGSICDFVVLRCVGFLVVVRVHKLIYVQGYGIVCSIGTQFHESCGGRDFVTIGIANNMPCGLTEKKIEAISSFMTCRLELITYVSM